MEYDIFLAENDRGWKVISYICGFLIHTVWIKWNKTPVIVTFSDRSTPVWKVPFPTITICPDAKANSSKFKYSEEIERLQNELSENSSSSEYWTDDRILLFDAMAQVCDFKFSQSYKIGLEFANGSFKNILKSVAPDIDIAFCTWRGKDSDCEDIFDLIITERGVCYSFNFLNASDIYREDVLFDETVLQQKGNKTTKWTREFGFDRQAKHENFPYRTFNAYVKYGLVAGFYSYISDLDKTCNAGDEGFKISIDTPGDIPQLSKYYFSIPFDQEVLIDITPEVIESSEKTKEYSPDIRKCFFPTEKQLRYFKIYSQSNCEFECLANYTLEKCGCVRFNMPRVEGTRVCAEDLVPCYQNAKRQMREDTFQSEHLTQNTNVSILADCNCLPSCRSLTYSVGITQGKLGTQMKNLIASNDIKVTIFKVYFKEDRFWAKRRTKFYGFIDFIAHAGGLLGLFMGISAISVVEILYFIIVRIWGNIRNERLKRELSENHCSVVF